MEGVGYAIWSLRFMKWGRQSAMIDGSTYPTDGGRRQWTYKGCSGDKWRGLGPERFTTYHQTFTGFGAFLSRTTTTKRNNHPLKNLANYDSSIETTSLNL
jgi:hypothetical protein